VKKKPTSKRIGTESLAKRLNLLLIRSKRKLTKLRMRSRLQLVDNMFKKRRIRRLQNALKKQLRGRLKKKQN
jgi:hypothetical protein